MRPTIAEPWLRLRSERSKPLLVMAYNQMVEYLIRFASISFWRPLRREKVHVAPSRPRDLTSLRRELAQRIDADAGALGRAAARISASSLSLDDISIVVADAIKSSEHRVLEHVGRVVTLMNVKQGDAMHEKARVDRIHARLTMVESVLRRLTRAEEERLDGHRRVGT
jgi:hypothetical protein